MPLSPSRPHAAYCEEYNEDAHTTLPETRQSANVAAKRSKPEIAKTRASAAIHDEFSDSGYSSRTGATLGSGDSSLASKAERAPLNVGSGVAGNKTSRVPPQESPQKALQTPRKPTLRRTDSKARGPRQENGNDGQERAAKVHQTAKPVEKGHAGGYGSIRQASLCPPELTSRPASTKPLPPNPAYQVPIPQPAQVRPRPTTSHSYRTGRPVSFHAGVTPQISYMPSLYIPPVAYPTHAPSPAQTNSYFVPQQSPVQPQAYSFPPSPYDPQPRPPTRQWTSEQPAPYRHSLVYSANPLTGHTQPPSYPPMTKSAQYAVHVSAAQTAGQPSHRERRYSRDEDYNKMPPPPIPSKSEPEQPQNQRPIIRHAATTSATLLRRSGRTKEYRADLKGPPSPQKQKLAMHESSNRPHVATRPSATSSNNSAPSTHAIERDMARLSVDNERSTKQKRRMSYHGHESHRDLERSAEAYQKVATGTETLPMTADSLNLVHKRTSKSNTSSQISGRSGRVSRAGSDVKSRSSADRRGGSDVKSGNDNDGLTMRFNASHGVNVDLKGGSVEGRTISLRQSRDGGDGDMEFSIGARSTKTSSKSELREKSRKKYSLFGGSGIRELEPATSTGRDESKSRSKKGSRRSSRSGRG